MPDITPVCLSQIHRCRLPAMVAGAEGSLVRVIGESKRRGRIAGRGPAATKISSPLPIAGGFELPSGRFPERGGAVGLKP